MDRWHRRAPRLTAAVAATARDRAATAFPARRHGVFYAAPSDNREAWRNVLRCSPRRRATARRNEVNAAPAGISSAGLHISVRATPSVVEHARSDAAACWARLSLFRRAVCFSPPRTHRARKGRHCVFVGPPRTRRVSLRLCLSLSLSFALAFPSLFSRSLARSLVLVRWLRMMMIMTMAMTTPTGISYNYRVPRLKLKFEATLEAYAFARAWEGRDEERERERGAFEKRSKRGRQKRERRRGDERSE